MAKKILLTFLSLMKKLLFAGENRGTQEVNVEKEGCKL
jgi:hypothetical protein